MGRAGKIARRTFLVGAVAVAGGVAFGYWRYRGLSANPLPGTLGEGEMALTPYVIVAKDGIKVVAPRAAMGQGAQSALAMLVAEEMDLDWDSLEVVHGPPSAAYVNTAVLGEALPFDISGPGIGNSLMRGAVDAAGTFLGFQITGGSSSVPDGFDKMRKAGAAARVVMLQAAAKRSGVAMEKLKTESSAVILPDGTKLHYVDLIPEAQGISPPGDPALKPRDRWRLIGKQVTRKGIEARSTGTERYGIDMDLPGMVYATVRTNPHFGAGVDALDTKDAEAARGVKKVISVTGGYAVVADNTWRAFQAADMVRAVWKKADYPPDTKGMFDVLEKSFTEDHVDSRDRNNGNLDEALDGAGKVTAEYRAPFLAHAPMEPMNATVMVKDGALTIWAGVQVPLFAAAAAAKAAGADPDRVTLHVLPMGGSFGRRLEDDFLRQAAEVAAAMPGVPVKMTWSREEDMTHDFCRPLAMARGQGAVADGKITAFDLSIAAPSTTASQMGRLGVPAQGPDKQIVAGAADQPFAIPAYRVTGYRAPEMAPVSSWRSVGASLNGFFHESLMDELIQKAGADPLAERLRLVDDAPARKVLEAVGEMSNWGGALPEGYGRGLAFTRSFGVPVAEVVDVEQTEGGIAIRHVFVAADLGVVVDPRNASAQMEGGVIWGLGHAMGAEITFADGAIEQSNFDSYPYMRINQCPQIVTRALSVGPRVHGIGEPCVPPAAPALAAAITRITGKRPRAMPFSAVVDFA